MSATRKTGQLAPREEELWADLANSILVIAREVQFRGYEDPRAVPLSQSEGIVMRHMQRLRSASPTAIAGATGIQRPNLTPVLKSLESKGLIQRTARPEDGRGSLLVLTERGRENYRLVRREWAKALNMAAGGAGQDLAAAADLLSQIEQGLAAARPAAGRQLD